MSETPPVETLVSGRVARWAERVSRYQSKISHYPGLVAEGVLKRVVGLTLEAEGCQAAVGGRCRIVGPDRREVEAEVVGFAEDKLYLMPTRELQGLVPNARVIPTQGEAWAPVGDALLGRVIDGEGRPLDGRGPLRTTTRMSMNGAPINPLARQPVREPLDVGVRSINALLSVGRGQRMGLFAGSGVGKSVLLGMMTRYTEADVIVVGLIGERGREVKEFIEDTLGEAGLRRAVVVACPADTSPLMRLHGARLATTVAEHFRDQGRNVLLLMDSLTRYAQAQREIALAIGEPPATKGYPPSVFARMPQLVERAGNGDAGQGSITAFYTVLTEGDDHNDPIADAARAILDGHLVLSRALAESGLYPAIDIEASASRTLPQVTAPEHMALITEFRQLYSAYRKNRDLINVGAYQPGSDPRVDRAIACWPKIRSFLSQDIDQSVGLGQSLEDLIALIGASVDALSGPEPRVVMKRSDRLGLVTRVFDGRQRQAAIELGQHEKTAGDAHRRLAELTSYRAGYAERMTTPGAVDPRQLRELSVLVGRLDAAIRQQQVIVAGAERNRDEARSRWLASRQRHHAVSQACTRQVDLERIEDDRREQKESDELTARRFPIG